MEELRIEVRGPCGELWWQGGLGDEEAFRWNVSGMGGGDAERNESTYALASTARGLTARGHIQTRQAPLTCPPAIQFSHL